MRKEEQPLQIEEASQSNWKERCKLASAEVERLSDENDSLRMAAADDLVKLVSLSAENAKHLSWAATWHDSLSAVATVLELSSADSAQEMTTNIVEAIRRLTAENTGLREDKARLDYMADEYHGVLYVNGDWCCGPGFNPDLRSAIDAARGAK